MKHIMVTMITAVLMLFGLDNVGQVKLKTDGFGQVQIFKRPTNEQQKYVLLFSDDAGWDSRMDEMAQQIANDKAVVLGIDLNKVKSLSGNNLNAEAFAKATLQLSKAVQKLLEEPTYQAPAIVFINDRRALGISLAENSAPHQIEAITSVGACPSSSAVLDSLDSFHSQMPTDTMTSVSFFTDSNSTCDFTCQKLSDRCFKFKNGSVCWI